MIATPRFAIEQALRTEPFSMSADHVHQAHEIYYLLAGERYYYINQRVYALQKGDLIWISKHDFHRTSNKGNGSHERILINFDEAFVATSMPDAPSSDQKQPLLPEKSFLLRPSAEEQRELEHLFQQMLDEYHQDHAYRHMYLQSLLLQLLIRIVPHTILHPRHHCAGTQREAAASVCGHRIPACPLCGEADPGSTGTAFLYQQYVFVPYFQADHRLYLSRVSSGCPGSASTSVSERNELEGDRHC